MAKKQITEPVAEPMSLQSKATIKQVKVRLCDIDDSPSIYSHRDPKIYIYNQKDDNEARRLVHSLTLEGQKNPIAYCVINGRKMLLCGWRRLAAFRTAIELHLDPARFFLEMELVALEVQSTDPNDFLEWSITENEVRVGFTEEEKVTAARKMLDAGFSATRAAKALGMSATQFHRIQRRFGSEVMLDCIKNEALTATDVDNLLEGARDAPKLEEDIKQVVAKVQAHIAGRRATAVGRQETFDEDKFGKVRKYIRPAQIKQWVEAAKEGRSIDWEPESEETGWTYVCEFNVKEGKLKIQALTADTDRMPYENFAQVCAKVHVLDTELTAEFLRKKAVRDIQGLRKKTAEGQGVLEYYRLHKADDLAADLERRVAEARGEADPAHGKVEPRQEQSIAGSIEVHPLDESTHDSQVPTQPQNPDTPLADQKRRRGFAK